MGGIHYYCSNTLHINIMISFIGLLVGSFLNVIIYRLPIVIGAGVYEARTKQRKSPFLSNQTITLYSPRSFCCACGASIPIWLNIPILSFFLLKGRTACCNEPLSRQYPIVELLTATTSFLLSRQFDPTPSLIAGLAFSYILITLAFIDWNTLTLPDEITLPALWLGLFSNDQCIFVSLHDALLGALLGYTSSFLIAWTFLKFKKTHGLGQGDFKLIAMLGAWLGWSQLPSILLIASFTGILFTTPYIISKKLKYTSQIPFAPFLALGGLIIILKPSLWG